MRYFIVKYYQKPDGKYNEVVKVDDKLRNKDQVEAQVIIDYKDQKIVKCRFNGELPDNKFETINNFYKGHYPDIIKSLEAKFQALEEIKEEIMEEVNDTK